IVSRYDIILILELVDRSGSAIKILLKALNKGNKNNQYSLKISRRLGRSSYKEQFVFLYRNNLVDLVDTYQFDDIGTLSYDVFARDPYIVRFKCLTSELDFVLIPVHTTPEEAEAELDKLHEVFMDVKEKWQTDNIMILGDFNADGSYLSEAHMNMIRIRSDEDFHWLISDDQDTTTSTMNTNTYD
ncbi:hypothetical protein NL108_007572, partial [Boleophthalmus pectinirostris]